MINGLVNFIIDLVFSFIPDTRFYWLKRCLLRMKGFKIGKNVRVISSAKFKLRSLQVGDNSFIGHEVFIAGGDTASVTIGGNVDIAPRCMLVSGTHEIGNSSHRAGQGICMDIDIGNGVWMGAGVIVIAGVKVGEGSVIAAGSVLIQKYPKNSLIVGVPGEIKKKLE